MRYNNKSTEDSLLKFKLVQEGWQKAFVLIQTAIGKLNITDFALKVEQSEIVDQLLRILNALHEYCIEYKANHKRDNEQETQYGKAKLLILCVILKRALIQRAWDEYQTGEDGILSSCISNQCKLLESTKQHLQHNLQMHNVNDLLRILTDYNLEFPINIDKIRSIARCSINEANLLSQIIPFYLNNKLSYQLELLEKPQGNWIRIAIKKLFQESTLNNSFTKPIFIMIAYMITNEELLCYRKLPTEFPVNGIIEYEVPLLLHSKSILTHFNNGEAKMILRDINICIICENMIGFDQNIPNQQLNDNSISYNYIPKEMPTSAEQPLINSQKKATKKQKTSISNPTNNNSKGSKSTTDNFLQYFSLRNGNPNTNTNHSNSYPTRGNHSMLETTDASQDGDILDLNDSAIIPTNLIESTKYCIPKGFMQLEEEDNDEEINSNYTTNHPTCIAEPKRSVNFIESPKFSQTKWIKPNSHIADNSALSRIRQMASEHKLDHLCPVQRFRPRKLQLSVKENELSNKHELDGNLPTLYANDNNNIGNSNNLFTQQNHNKPLITSPADINHWGNEQDMRNLNFFHQNDNSTEPLLSFFDNDALIRKQINIVTPPCNREFNQKENQAHESVPHFTERSNQAVRMSTSDETSNNNHNVTNYAKGTMQIQAINKEARNSRGSSVSCISHQVTPCKWSTSHPQRAISTPPFQVSMAENRARSFDDLFF